MFNQEIEKDTFTDISTIDASTFNEDSTITKPTSVDVTLFSNPVSSLVNLQFNKNFDAIELALFSSAGQLLFVQQLNEVNKDHVLSLEVNQLPAGIYYLKLISIGQQKVLPFVKQ